jgi:hypothetical protein
MQVIDLKAPAGPSILVQRRSKEVVDAPVENREEEEAKEDKIKETQEPKDANDTNQEVMWGFFVLKGQFRISV